MTKDDIIREALVVLPVTIDHAILACACTGCARKEKPGECECGENCNCRCKLKTSDQASEGV